MITVIIKNDLCFATFFADYVDKRRIPVIILSGQYPVSSLKPKEYFSAPPCFRASVAIF
jgi:hypothetical protein